MATLGFLQWTHSSKLSFDLGLGYTICAARKVFDDGRSLAPIEARRDFLEFTQKIFSLGEQALPDVQVNELTNIIIPTERAPKQTRNKFVSSLATFNWTYCKTGNRWKLDQSQISELNRYLYLNELMVECLDLATLSNRQLFRDTIFHPQVAKIKSL